MLKTISEVVWGLPTVIIMVSLGIFLSVKCSFFQITHIFEVFRKTIGSLKKNGSGGFKAMCMALGSTIGVGNIVGVASAITIAGPGTIFWIWVSGFLGMITKFVEICISVHYSTVNSKGERVGGPMYNIIYGLPRKFKFLSIIFSSSCLLASFGIGNMAQINAVSDNLEFAFNMPKILSAFLVLIPIVFLIFGSNKRLSNFCAFFVPVMSSVYILGTLFIIFSNASNFIPAIKSIFSSAFSIKSFSGGLLASQFLKAVRTGLSRGIFTNEAGMGSSPIAHASAENADPVTQGFWGIFEVFVDTVIVCTVTALCVLCSGFVDLTSGATVDCEASALVNLCFDRFFGRAGGVFIALSILFFAFASVLGWSYYGAAAWEYLFGGKTAVYKVIFTAFVLLGTN
ncbi:MAG: amino acid carrier protein, partial [bacterium]|nr:amino acid carrier protein [bacterium]